MSIVVEGKELEVVRIDGRRTDAPTIVFLHEGLGSAGLWRAFPAAVAARTGCPAVVYSRYGNGFSTPIRGPRTPQYMHVEAHRALPALFDALEVDETILVGHSDGASIALLYAAQNSRRVRALVTEAPHVFVEDLSVSSIAAIRVEYQTTNLRERMSRHHADADATFYSWNDVWLSPEFRSWNIVDSVAAVESPILALQGIDDQYGTPAQIEAIGRCASGPVDRVLLAGCKHAPHLDRRAFVEALVSGWIEERLA